MILRCAAVFFVTALLARSGSDDVPPASLLRENVRKASVIINGKIESSEAPRPGVTIAHFRVSHSYRGPFKSGDEVAFASFKEQDRYPERFLHGDLVVFLRRRRTGYTPPKWETATDLSEFIFTPELEAILTSELRRTHR
jgi:hypothetical protein